jgi:hypothetical protein
MYTHVSKCKNDKVKREKKKWWPYLKFKTAKKAVVTSFAYQELRMVLTRVKLTYRKVIGYLGIVSIYR